MLVQKNNFNIEQWCIKLITTLTMCYILHPSNWNSFLLLFLSTLIFCIVRPQKWVTPGLKEEQSAKCLNILALSLSFHTSAVVPAKEKRKDKQGCQIGTLFLASKIALIGCQFTHWVLGCQFESPILISNISFCKVVIGNPGL